MLNNDTEIYEDNWVEVINKKYNKYKFHVLGPDIVSIDGKNHANPMNQKIKNKRDLIKLIIIQIIELFKNYLYVSYFIRKIKCKIKGNEYLSNANQKIEHDMIDVQLQGSCFILSKLYLNKYEGLYNKTFLYYEEDILKYIAERDNLMLVYTPDIILLHKESLSTNLENKDNRAKNIFSIKHSLKSCFIFLNLMKE